MKVYREKATARGTLSSDFCLGVCLAIINLSPLHRRPRKLSAGGSMPFCQILKPIPYSLKWVALCVPGLFLAACGGGYSPSQTLNTKSAAVGAPLSPNTGAVQPVNAMAQADVTVQRAYSNLQAALNGRPLYLEDVEPYNAAVTVAYNTWVEAQSAKFGPNWESLYIEEQRTIRMRACQDTKAPPQSEGPSTTACAQTAASEISVVPTLPSLLVTETASFKSYVETSDVSASNDGDVAAAGGSMETPYQEVARANDDSLGPIVF